MKTTDVLLTAATMFAAAAVVSPAGAQSSQARTWCYASDTTDDQTITGCTQVIQSSRGSQKDLRDAYHNRGIAYKHKGDYDRAIADYAQAIKLDPKNASAYNSRGVAYDAKGDPDRAMADYNEALRLDPKDASAYYNRGLGYYDKADYDRAIADYDEALRFEPKDPPTYKSRGDAYRAKGDRDRAIADYNEAIRFDPDFAEAYNNRGAVYNAKDDHDRAITDFTKAIELDPKYASAYNNRGTAYADVGATDRANADYAQAIKLAPKETGGYFNRGRLNLFAGALPQALADFNQTSELKPKNAYAALWLDIATRRSNLPSRLAEATKQVDMTKWPAPMIRLYLGQLTQEAVLAAAADPDTATNQGHVCEANFYGGELVLQQGKKDQAARLFGLVTANCPHSFVEYKGAVAELKGLGR